MSDHELDLDALRLANRLLLDTIEAVAEIADYPGTNGDELVAALTTLRRERDECRASHFAKAEEWHGGAEVLGWKTRAEQAEARLQALEAARQLALTVLRDAEQARADASLADAAREPRA